MRVEKRVETEPDKLPPAKPIFSLTLLRSPATYFSLSLSRFLLSPSLEKCPFSLEHIGLRVCVCVNLYNQSIFPVAPVAIGARVVFRSIHQGEPLYTRKECKAEEEGRYVQAVPEIHGTS